jgi:hypothetical protein
MVKASAPNVLHQRMPGDDHSGVAVLLEPTHRPKPRLQAAVIRLDAVVGVLLGAVPGRGQQLLSAPGYTGAWSVTTLDRGDLGRAHHLLEEPVGGFGVPPRGDEHVDDLTELVDRAIDIASLAGDLHIGLVHEPAIPGRWRHGRAASASSGVNRSTHR